MKDIFFNAILQLERSNSNRGSRESFLGVLGSYGASDHFYDGVSLRMDIGPK